MMRQDRGTQIDPFCAAPSADAAAATSVQNGGSRASWAWIVMTQRDEEAGLTALPGRGAGLTAVKAACD